MIKIFLLCIQFLQVFSQNNCLECIERQSAGENIPCLCNNICPDIICDIYCEYGHEIDSNGCLLCSCNNNLPRPIKNVDCLLEQPSCDDYDYVCPKIEEITYCNNGGIDGYTTFRLSLIIKDNMNIKNIYAIYGNSKNNELMYIPEAYQSQLNINSNIGGVNPYLITIDPTTEYDSWLTIGITEGDINNELSSIGIDFNQWKINNPLTITDGAVFVMNPENIIINGNEYCIGQFTVRENSNPNVIINVQGKTIDRSEGLFWNEDNIIFSLRSPINNNIINIPTNCLIWYDGCNTCKVNNGILNTCTNLICFQLDNQRCIEYINIGH